TGHRRTCGHDVEGRRDPDVARSGGDLAGPGGGRPLVPRLSDDAGKRARDAVRSARELGHPLTLGNGLGFTSVVQTCRHELDEVRQHAAELRTLATEHGFGRLGPHGTILGGWALVHQQQVEQGLAWIREGLASYEATSLLLFRPWYLALLA